ncbi:type I secretion C-terminal target domain-containing protein, partial [Marinobacterium sp. MBR-109]|uniref:type I secretion C-terminal target domain-containing protein n=1 Tax=Marinobacterium sp. MBR-109 TaxID=3156462 RepID=UPI003399042F
VPIEQLMAEVTVSDGALSDVDSDTSQVTAVNDDPIITTDAVIISEEGLANGLPDNEGNSDTTDSAVASGQVMASDVEGDALTYSLSAPVIGLTSGGQPVTWSGNGTGTNGLVGATQLTGATAMATVLVVSIDSNGAWTAELQGPVDHADTSSEDTLAFDIGVTVSDGNGGSDTGFLTVTVEDDSPELNSFDGREGVNSVPNVIGSYEGTFDGSFGADGIGGILFGGATALTGVTYSSETNPVTGVLTVTATVDSTGADFFTLTVNPDGHYTFDILGSRPTTENTVSFSGVQGSAAVSSLTIGDVTFTSTTNIKPTSSGFGVNSNGNFDPGEDFTMAVSGNDVDSVSLYFKMQGSGSLDVSWQTDAGETGSVSVSDNGWVIFDPTNSFSEISFTATADGSATSKIEGVAYSQDVLPENQPLIFSLGLEDADGDVSSYQDLNINLLGTSEMVGTSSADTINGGTGDDIIIGSDGDDVIFGNLGDDILYGDNKDGSGSGADTFVWKSGESGTDIVADFDASEGDVLDLSELLQDGENAGSIDSYLQAIESNGSTTLYVSSNGSLDSNDLGGTADQVIELTDVTGFDVNALIQSGNINVDQS